MRKLQFIIIVLALVLPVAMQATPAMAVVSQLTWTERDAAGQIESCVPGPGCGPVTTVNGTGASRWGLWQDGSTLYWTIDTGVGSIQSCNLVGGACSGATTTIVSGQNRPLGIWLDGTTLYWTEYNTKKVRSCTLSGGVCGAVTDVITGQGALDLWLSGTTLYYSDWDGGAIESCTLSGGTCGAPTTVISGISYNHGLVLDGTTLYWAEWGNNRIRSCTLSGGTCGAPTTVQSGLAQPIDLVWDGTDLYWTNYAGGTIQTCTLAGGVCSAAPVTVQSGLSLPLSLIGPAAPANAPDIELPGTDPVTVDENVWIVLDSTGTATDPNGDWDGGTLQVQVTSGTDGADDLQVRDYGNCSPAATEIIDIFDLGGGVREIRRCGPTNGAYTVIGTYTGRNTNNMTVTFNANATNAWVQDVVQSIRFRATAIVPTTPKVVTFTLTDAASNSDSDTVGVNVNGVNDAPTIAQWNNNPDPEYIEDSAPIRLDSNATAADADGGTLDGTTVTLFLYDTTCQSSEDVLGIGNYGNITTSGANVFYSGTVIGTFTGGPNYCQSGSPLVVTLDDTAIPLTLSHLEAVINAFTYENTSDTPTHDTDLVYPERDRRLRLSISQLGHTRNYNAKYINIVPVSDAPEGTDKTITILEDSSHTFAATDFGFTDPNDSPADTFTRVKITTLPAAGTLELSSVAVTAGDFITVANIPNLVFAPAANGEGSPYTSFTFQVEDNGSTANGGVILDQTANTITFNVTGQNDDPTDISLDNSSVDENKAVNTVVGTLSTTDPDSGDSFTYSFNNVTAGCNNSGSANFNINGSDLRTSVVFDYETPPTSFNLCVETKDSGGVTYTKELTITVNNVNEAPVNSVPATQSTNDNTPMTFSAADSNLISISDVDAGSADVEMTLSVTNGTLTLGSFASLNFSAGNGVDDATMTFQGTIAEINAALDGLEYTPTTGFSGTATLTVTTDDLGESGSGGAQSDTDTVDIKVADFAPTVGTLSAYISSAGASSLNDGDTLRFKPTDLIVAFSEVMDNATVGDQVTNSANYYLIGEGSLAGIQTAKATDICAKIEASGIDSRDELLNPLTVTAQNSPITDVKVHVSNIGLDDGEYLFVACGSATLRDLNGNALAGDGTNGGTDFRLTFYVRTPSQLPATGFAPNEITRTYAQPEESAYAGTGMALYIPSIGESLTIVGVPEQNDGWNLSWLGDQAGWLAGSAYPTWSGNTLITAHVWDAYNQPGPFYNLKQLHYGEYVYIYAHGRTYTYEIRQNMSVDASDVSLFYRHEEMDWVTLITCEDYLEASGTYKNRRIVRAVLVDVR